MSGRQINLGEVKNEIFREFRKMGIVEVRATRRSDILYGRRVDGTEVKIQLRKVPVVKKGKIIDIRLDWYIV